MQSRPHQLARLFSFENFLLLLLWCSPLWFNTDGPQLKQVLRDPDIWWHLRNAETLFNQGHVIVQDAYSFTVTGKPWIDPEWLAEVPFYLGYRVWGDRGLYYVGLMAFELIILAVYRLSIKRSHNFIAAYVATAVFVYLAVINFGLRTILFGYICLAAEMVIFQAYRARQRLLWWLVPIFWLWINLHGSWPSGLVFLGLFIASGLFEWRAGLIQANRWTPNQLRQLCAVAAASVAAIFVNPYGWHLVVYPFDLLLHQRLNLASGEEWRGVDFQSPNGLIFLLLLAGIAMLSLLRRRAWPFHEVLFTLLAVYSACTHQRFLFIAGIVLAPIIAAEIAGEGPAKQSSKNRPWVNALLMTGVLLVAFSRFPRAATLEQGREEAFPAAAFAYLQTIAPPNRVFNAYAYGGYIIWRARNIPVFIDSRTDIFEHHGVLADYLNAISFKDTLAIFDRYGIQVVFFPKSDPLVYLLQNTPGWELKYDDGKAVILQRSDATYASAGNK